MVTANTDRRFPPMTTPETAQPDIGEATMRERLRAGDFIIRDAARDSVETRWGQDWLGWLRAAAARLAETGVASWDAQTGKWTLTDRKDRLVMSSDGRVIVAAFPGSVDGAEVLERVAAGDFELSETTAKLVGDRLGEAGVARARARVLQMAKDGSITWRGDHANGGWRVASGGDVALFDAQGRAVYKLFWSELDDREAVDETQLRDALRAGSVRPGRKLAARLERAWGSDWHDEYQTRCQTLAETGVVEDHNGTAFKVTGDGLSLLVSTDGQVAVSAHIELAGDADEIMTSIRSGKLTVHSSMPRAAERFRSSADSVYRHFAARLAADGIGTLEQTGTYWALRYGWVEVTISADGQAYTSLTARNTDDASDAAGRVAAGLFWARPGARKGMVGLSEDWYRSVGAADMIRTPRGWRCQREGYALILDHSSTLIVACEPVSDQVVAGKTA